MAGSAQGWTVLGTYAEGHDASSEAAQAFLRAAGLAPSNRGRLLVAAGFHLIDGKLHESRELFSEGSALPEVELLSELGLAMCDLLDRGGNSLNIDSELEARLRAAADDPGILTYLASQAAFRGERTRAIDLWERKLRFNPDNAEVLSNLSFSLAIRAQSSERQSGDEQRAIDIGLSDLTQLHEWNGPTADILVHLLLLLTNAHNWAKVIELSLAPPFGAATEEEATRPGVIIVATTAAGEIGRRDLVDELIGRLPEGPDRTYASARRTIDTEGIDPRSPAWIELWEEVLSALGDNRPDQINYAVMQLAIGGVDRSDRLNGLDFEFGFVTVDLDLELPIDVAGDAELKGVATGTELDLRATREGVDEGDQSVGDLLARQPRFALELDVGHDTPPLMVWRSPYRLIIGAATSLADERADRSRLALAGSALPPRATLQRRFHSILARAGAPPDRAGGAGGRRI